MSGKIIAFEGLDFSGKSAVIDELKPQLEALYPDQPLFISEPGGTPLADQLRKILQTQKLDKISKALLFATARANLVHEVIIPALKNNKIIILDRFIASTLAYQIDGDHQDPKTIKNILAYSIYDDDTQTRIQPDLTFYLDIPLEILNQRRKDHAVDNLDKYQDQYYQAVQKHYFDYCQMTTKRQKVIPIYLNQNQQISVEPILNTLTSFINQN